jgi:hypothetical protein
MSQKKILVVDDDPDVRLALPGSPQRTSARRPQSRCSAMYSVVFMP